MENFEIKNKILKNDFKGRAFKDLIYENNLLEETYKRIEEESKYMKKEDQEKLIFTFKAIKLASEIDSDIEKDYKNKTCFSVNGYSGVGKTCSVELLSDKEIKITKTGLSTGLKFGNFIPLNEISFSKDISMNLDLVFTDMPSIFELNEFHADITVMYRWFMRIKHSKEAKFIFILTNDDFSKLCKVKLVEKIKNICKLFSNLENSDKIWKKIFLIINRTDDSNLQNATDFLKEMKNNLKTENSKELEDFLNYYSNKQNQSRIGLIPRINRYNMKEFSDTIKELKNRVLNSDSIDKNFIPDMSNLFNGEKEILAKVHKINLEDISRAYEEFDTELIKTFEQILQILKKDDNYQSLFDLEKIKSLELKNDDESVLNFVDITIKSLNLRSEIFVNLKNKFSVMQYMIKWLKVENNSDSLSENTLKQILEKINSFKKKIKNSYNEKRKEKEKVAIDKFTFLTQQIQKYYNTDLKTNEGSNLLQKIKYHEIASKKIIPDLIVIKENLQKVSNLKNLKDSVLVKELIAVDDNFKSEFEIFYESILFIHNSEKLINNFHSDLILNLIKNYENTNNYFHSFFENNKREKI